MNEDQQLSINGEDEMKKLLERINAAKSYPELCDCFEEVIGPGTDLEAYRDAPPKNEADMRITIRVAIEDLDSPDKARFMCQRYLLLYCVAIELSGAVFQKLGIEKEDCVGYLEAICNEKSILFSQAREEDRRTYLLIKDRFEKNWNKWSTVHLSKEGHRKQKSALWSKVGDIEDILKPFLKAIYAREEAESVGSSQLYRYRGEEVQFYGEEIFFSLAVNSGCLCMFGRKKYNPAWMHCYIKSLQDVAFPQREEAGCVDLAIIRTAIRAIPKLARKIIETEKQEGVLSPKLLEEAEIRILDIEKNIEGQERAQRKLS